MISSFALALWAPFFATSTAKERKAPLRPPPRGPVFLTDCVTPADHSTLLLLHWRAQEDQPSDGSDML